MLDYYVIVYLHFSRNVVYVDSHGKGHQPNQFVSVSLGTQSYSTAVQKSVNSTHYNCRFQFHIKATCLDLCAHLIDISVNHQHTVTSELIGCIGVCPATVYERSSHLLARILRHIYSPVHHNRSLGLLCFSIVVLTDLDPMPDFFDGAIPVDAVEARGRPISTEPAHTELSVSVHLGQDIAPLPAPGVPGGIVRETFVEVRHGETHLRTKIDRDTESPEWRTKFTIPSVQPPLDGVLRILLYAGEIQQRLYGYALIEVQGMFGEAKEAWLNFYWRPPDAVQGSAQSLKDTALNFVRSYTGSLGGIPPHSPLTLPWDRTPEDISNPVAYGGRVLLTAMGRRVSTRPRIQITPAEPVQGPSSMKRSLHCRAIEVTGVLGNVGPIRLGRVCFGPGQS